MDDVFIPNDILHDILARLPAKSLMRFRCVSRHWNRLITDPYFMKLRSRRMIILTSLHLIDDNVPIQDTAHSKAKLQFHFPHQEGTDNVAIIGTFNGIVLLVLSDQFQNPRMILYNPITRASKQVPDPPYPCHGATYAFGFGYGETTNDLKIVRIEVQNDCYFDWNTFDVNKYDMVVILALDVKKMVLLKIDVPDRCHCTLLGSLNGDLCIISMSSLNEFDVWLMKEEKNSWCKAFSFTMGLKGIWCNMFFPVSMLDRGKIIMIDSSYQLFIYDTVKRTCKSVSVENFQTVYGMEYIESLVSPSDMCLV
ncbi:hypothetical protein LXL04_012523 [Taraxacum kok-saghyz]